MGTMKETTMWMKLSKYFLNLNVIALMVQIVNKRGEMTKNVRESGRLEDITTMALKVRSMITKMKAKKKSEGILRKEIT